MKNLILALSALITLNVSSHAFASSPVVPQPNAIAELRVSGGMPVPGGLGSRHLWITNGGEVFVKEYFYGKDSQGMFDRSTEREYLLGTIPEGMEDLRKATAAIRGGGLTKAEGPKCMDAPGFSYGVVRNGILVTVYSRFNCRDSELKDKSQRPNALAIKAYLDQWNKIAAGN